MLKVQIIGPRSLLDEAVREIHAAAVVHVETLPEKRLLESEFLGRFPIEREKLMEKEALEKYAERLRSFKALIPVPSSHRIVRVGFGEIHGYMAELSAFEERARELRARKDSLADELSIIIKYEKLLRGFAPIVTRLGGLRNFDITGLTLERTREDISGLLETEVARVTEGKYSVHTREIDEHTLGVVLTYPKSYGPQVKALLSGKAVSEMRLPDEYSDMTLIEALKLMGMRSAELPGLMSGVDGELYSISTVWYGTVIGVARAIEDSLEEIGVLSYASATRFAFIIEGWVPGRRVRAACVQAQRPLSRQDSPEDARYQKRRAVFHTGLHKEPQAHTPVRGLSCRALDSQVRLDRPDAICRSFLPGIFRPHRR